MSTARLFPSLALALLLLAGCAASGSTTDATEQASTDNVDDLGMHLGRQRFGLRRVTLGATTEVSEIPLDGQNQAEVALTGLGTEYQHAVVVIVGVTEGTTEPARYRYEATSVG